jgi:hypothetical protein
MLASREAPQTRQVQSALGPQRAQIALAGIRRVVGRPSAHPESLRSCDPKWTTGASRDGGCFVQTCGQSARETG